jgi:predicted RNase H-like nuclease (RuvC/YqgF family)
MKEKKLTKTKQKSYLAKERLKIVADIRAEIKTFKQSSSEYAQPISKLRKWNRWYFKICILRYFRAKPKSRMRSKDQQIQQLKKQLQEYQALVDKLELKTIVLEKTIDIAEKELKIDIRKKCGTKQSGK